MFDSSLLCLSQFHALFCANSSKVSINSCKDRTHFDTRSRLRLRASISHPRVSRRERTARMHTTAIIDYVSVRCRGAHAEALTCLPRSSWSRPPPSPPGSGGRATSWCTARTAEAPACEIAPNLPTKILPAKIA